MPRIGMPEYQIAHSIRVSVRTLRRFYGAAMLAAETAQNRQVLETLAHLARSGRNVAATIFWAKSRCGFGQPPSTTQYDPATPPSSALPHCTFITGPNGDIAPRR